MIKSKVEKRHYPRLIFHEPEKKVALISTEPEKITASSILNMSEGGLQISLKRSRLDQEIKQGKKIILKGFMGIDELDSITDIPVQAVWIMDNDHLEHILMGVAFSDLSEEQHQTIRSFIENRIAMAAAEGSK